MTIKVAPNGLLKMETAEAESDGTAVKPAETQAMLEKGVALALWVKSSIGPAVNRVSILRQTWLDKDRDRLRECMLVGTNGRVLVAAHAMICEGDPGNNPVIDVPREAAKCGKSDRELQFACSNEMTLFGKKAVWVDSAAHRIYDPPSGGPVTSVEPLGSIDPDSVIMIEFQVADLVKLAGAINSPSSDDSGLLRLAIPRNLEVEDSALVRAIGSNGVGVVLGKATKDAAGHAMKFNDRAAVVRAMWNALPEHARSGAQDDDAEDEQDQGTLLPGEGSAPRADDRSSKAGASSTEHEPWYAEWLSTPVGKLQLPPSLAERLMLAGMETVGDLNQVAQAYPNKHFRTIKGVGPEKAEKIGEAMSRCWSALAAAHAAATSGGSPAAAAAVDAANVM